MENVFLVLTDDRLIKPESVCYPSCHIFSSTSYLKRVIVKLFEGLL